MSGRNEQPQQTALTSAAPAGAAANEPVECLGLTFANDDERRAYFTARLREKLADPAFRAIEGFPQASDEDILALSDPPYFTCCPNPFLEDFTRCYGKPYDPSSRYQKKPFAADVSQGKNDTIYNAHAYHTKVPHKAIMRYILHYTEPGDIVFDGFCGTGMTGVAAQMCGTHDASLRAEIEREVPDAHWGMRYAILGDLSPAASFIAHCYNAKFDAELYAREAQRILRETVDELGWAYTTIVDGRPYPVDYFVFSDVFICESCNHEIVFLDAAMTADGTVKEPFPCPNCRTVTAKRKLPRAMEAIFDPFLQSTIQRAKVELVLVAYRGPRGRQLKRADEHDREVLQRSEQIMPPAWFPKDRMSDGDEGRRNDPLGLTHVHQFFTRRALTCMSLLWTKALQTERSVRDYVLFTVEQNVWGMSRLARYVPTHFSQGNCSAQGWIEWATGEEGQERVEQRHALLAQRGEVAA